MDALIIIPGRPMAKPRPRFVRQGNFVRAYSPKAKEEKAIVKEIKSQWQRRALDCPVVLTMSFFCQVTKASKRAVEEMLNGTTKHIKKPDIDNFGKAALDFLVMSGVLADDRQVYELAMTKGYAQEPQTIIKIEW